MSNQVLGRLESAEVLVAFPYRVVLFTAIVAVCHQYGYLGAQLRQFEGACFLVSLDNEPGVVRLTGNRGNRGASSRSCESEACYR